ncbi:MAG: Gfo/Idh/MocA family oxidoreductase [Phycisphaerae bacterium]|nr:Gfo/Idh/MocA family oxidoreductase [Phycisphaerae bacterium]
MNQQNHPQDSHVNRRDFMKSAALASVGTALGSLALSGCSGPARAAGFRRIPDPEPRDVVRIGFVGVGGMGTGHVNNLLRIEGLELVAVCDVVPEHAARSQELAVKAGRRQPTAYTRGEWDFKRMCDEEDLDLVYTATPWEWHVPVCVAAMKTGKHAATEVPAAVTVDECWELVETAERTGKHCIMMENCCYDRSELMVLNMVRQGLFGELVYGEGGYMHDLRSVKFSEGGEGLWRRAHAMTRNGNLYTTHGLGPIAQYMNINRGDRFDFLVSMSCNSRGLQAYAAESFPVDDPRRKEKYVLGDVNSSLIRTVNGRSILLQHDTNLPRPYSRLNTIQGTKGIFRGFPDQIHIDGRTKGHDWEPLDEYRKEFEHPLWKAMQEKAVGAGHGGMDFIEDYRLIHALRTGTAPDMDVYDAAAWSAISELTERSVANRSRSMDVPDFTRGQWKTNPPLGIIQG